MAELLRKTDINGRSLRVLKGDIARAKTDAIVNAADCDMQHDSGVAQAILRAGGELIREESARMQYIPEGHCATTPGGNLAAEYVIHAVGPTGRDPEADIKLSNAATNALAEADRLDVHSISIPALSCGIFGLARDECAKILLQAVRDWLQQNPNTRLNQVDMVHLDDQTAELFAETFDSMFGE